MKYRSLAAALAASVVAAASARRTPPTSRSPTGGPPAARRRRSPSSPRPSTPPATTGSTARSPAAASTARPIMISRITGGDPMAATQFNHGRQAEELVEAGLMRDLTDVADGRGLGRRRHRAVAARELHARRQGLLRAGQHPLLAVALAVEQGLRGRRRRRSRPTGTSSSPPRPKLREAGKMPLAVGRPALAASRRLQRADDRARRQGPVPEGLRRQGRRGRRRARGGEDLRGRRRRPRDVQGLERPGLEPGDQHGHHRQGRRPDHGRLGAGRVPGRGRGRRHGLHLPAGPRRQRDHLDRRRRLLLPAARRRGEDRGAGGARLGDVHAGDAGRLQPQEGLAAGPRATSTSPPPTTA